MIQDIDPAVYDREYGFPLPDDDSLVLSFRGKQVLTDRKGNLPGYKPAFGPVIYLFRIDQYRFFLAGNDYCPQGFGYTDLRDPLIGHPADYAVSTGYQLKNWYEDNRYCGRCGKKLVMGSKERSLVCECGNIVYPRIMPAIIVGIVDGDQIVLTEYAGRAYKRKALVAGFCEIGETAEDTVSREVREEVGLEVQDIRYFASQPWGFDSDLLLGFFCRVKGDKTIRREEDELAYAAWTNREDVPETDERSLTGTMMKFFKEGKVRFQGK